MNGGMAKERITCKTHCVKWNSIDKDCEIYGEHHPCPRKCYWWLKDQQQEKEKQSDKRRSNI